MLKYAPRGGRDSTRPCHPTEKASLSSELQALNKKQSMEKYGGVASTKLPPDF
jgi:hypothetical protein